MTRKCLRLGLTLASMTALTACAPPDADASAGDAGPGVPVAAAGVGRPDARAAGLLGTLEATVDGERITWYVVSGEVQGTAYASAAWLSGRSGGLRASIGGFVTRTPPLDSFERGSAGEPVSFGDYDGPVLSLALAVPGEAGPFRVELPGEESSSSFAYMSAARFGDLQVLYSAESGVIDVTRLELVDGRLHAEGTFHGTLRNLGDAPPLTITDGRFSVEDVPSVASITPGGSSRP